MLKLAFAKVFWLWVKVISVVKFKPKLGGCVKRKKKLKKQRDEIKELEKQKTKKSEQIQKELDKGSEKEQETPKKRKKWWKFGGE